MNVAISAPALSRADPTLPAFRAEGRDRLFLRAGTRFAAPGHAAGFNEEKEVALGLLEPGADYRVWLDRNNDLSAFPFDKEWSDATPIGGFHYAPGGNATGRAGGDDVPAINPFSIWDVSFRPACPDPRGMFVIALPDGSRSWIDIYKLGVNHLKDGTSRCGVTIADGESRPGRIGGDGKVANLDFSTAKELLAHHGKQLLTYDEFRVAAFGVTEKTAAGKDPKVTGLDKARTSAFGMMQATGNLWDWGTDGDPDSPRASIFGGSWWSGGDAGSRCADLDCWPEHSAGGISARGRCGHLMPV